MRQLSTCAVSVMIAVACSGKAEPTGGAASSAAGSGGAVAGGAVVSRDAGTPDAPRAADVKRTQDEASRLVREWLEAQNTGAFDAYAALYATRFEGVRRSGKRVARLDRARWLRDRARMFKAKMEVSATGIDIRVTRDTALVRFTQTWASGTYKDVGPKILVLVREGGALRITREEMLASEIEKGPPVDGDQFAFVAQLDATRVAALLQSGDDAWGRGEPRKVAGGDVPGAITLEREVDPAKLPPELARWRGEAVTLYGNDGTTCSGKVTGLVLVSRYLPYDQELRVEWEGMSDDDIAREVWQRGEPSIAAVVTVDETVDQTEAEPCGQVTFARLARLPAPVMWAREPADAELEERALKAFRALPAYKDLQRTFREPIPDLPAHTGRWEEYQGATPEVAVFRSPVSPARAFVAVSATAGPGCGDFEGALAAIWELTGDTLTPISGSSEMPDLVLDLEGDGEPEVIYEDRSQGLSRSLMTGRALDLLRATDQVTNMDCRC